MKTTGLIPVFNHSDVEVAKAVMEACYHAGIRVFEFTNRGGNALPVFSKLAAHAQTFPNFILGIGTIFSSEQAKDFYNAGAQFMVSPALVPEVADFANEKDFLWIPGCGSVTEIYTAIQMKAKVVKVFPGNVLGAAFVKSVKAVLPDIHIMPTGGVTPTFENLQSWFGAGSSFVGMGSQLFSKSHVEAKDIGSISKDVAKALSHIDKIKGR